MCKPKTGQAVSRLAGCHFWTEAAMSNTVMIDAAWCREREACYSDGKLAVLFNRPMTLMEVLTRQDGPWADVPAADRVWVFTREGATSERVQRRFACDCADRALMRARAAGREPAEASWNAVKVARRYADGKATTDELNAARTAAWAAEWAAEEAGGWAAGWAAARAAGWAAARASAWAAEAAGWAAAAEAAANIERAAQLSDAIRLLNEQSHAAEQQEDPERWDGLS